MMMMMIFLNCNQRLLLLLNLLKHLRVLSIQTNPCQALSYEHANTNKEKKNAESESDEINWSSTIKNSNSLHPG